MINEPITLQHFSFVLQGSRDFITNHRLKNREGSLFFKKQDNFILVKISF